MEEYDRLVSEGIERILSDLKWTKRDLSNCSDIPYRSLQNYLSGRNGMPVSTFLHICKVLRVDSDYVLYHQYNIEKWPMYDALWSTFGDFLLQLQHKPDEISLDDMELHNQKRAQADKFAKVIMEAYRNYRKFNHKLLAENLMPLDKPHNE